jgi:DNA replication protein DnaC
VQNLFRLKFIEDKANVILLGGVGLGKSHLATALGYTACLKGHSVLFATAVEVINTLVAAQNTARLKQELNKYLNTGAHHPGRDRVSTDRQDRGRSPVPDHQPALRWPEIFNNDSTLTSALLDRLLHHAETVLIEGKSYRMKDQIEH